MRNSTADNVIAETYHWYAGKNSHRNQITNEKMVLSQKSSESLNRSKQVGGGIHLHLQFSEGIVGGDASACGLCVRVNWDLRDPNVANKQ